MGGTTFLMVSRRKTHNGSGMSGAPVAWQRVVSTMSDFTRTNPVCPTCNAAEMHPTLNILLVKRFIGQDDEGDFSRCFVCAGYYDKDLNCLVAGNDYAAWKKFDREHPEIVTKGYFYE